jgi:hypothetical protein
MHTCIRHCILDEVPGKIPDVIRQRSRSRRSSRRLQPAAPLQAARGNTVIGVTVFFGLGTLSICSAVLEQSSLAVIAGTAAVSAAQRLLR